MKISPRRSSPEPAAIAPIATHHGIAQRVLTPASFDRRTLHGLLIGFIGVGAALDFLSGRSQRAPEWAQRANLEWAWRLSREPRRLALRYALSAIAFAKAIPEALT